MESKLNYSSIEAYSNAYAQIISYDFFSNHDVISGRQIVELCNIRQINLFVLKLIFKKWKKEVEKLQSPYFDYNDKSVAEALTSFMNVLSQNISIKRNHFEPLLEQAIFDTILLIFSPFEYYGKEINSPEKTKITLEELKENSKYIKINTFVLEALIADMKAGSVKEMYNDEAYSTLNKLFEENLEPKPEEFREYLERFSEISPLSFDMVFDLNASEDEKEEIKFIPPMKISKEKELATTSDFFNQQLTLNEKLNTSSKSTIADLHQKKKIDNIKKHISIYQRFMFINELFNGKVDEFDTAVESLDLCDNYEEALSFIEKDYMKKYRWNMEAEEVNEFLEILSKRFN